MCKGVRTCLVWFNSSNDTSSLLTTCFGTSIPRLCLCRGLDDLIWALINLSAVRNGLGRSLNAENVVSSKNEIFISASVSTGSDRTPYTFNFMYHLLGTAIDWGSKPHTMFPQISGFWLIIVIGSTSIDQVRPQYKNPDISTIPAAVLKWKWNEDRSQVAFLSVRKMYAIYIRLSTKWRLWIFSIIQLLPVLFDGSFDTSHLLWN